MIDIRLELDERLKDSFYGDPELIRYTVNSLFNKNMPDDTMCYAMPNEHLIEEEGGLKRRITDIEIKTISNSDNVYKYNIEFQLQKYDNMATRMFEYIKDSLKINHELGTVQLPEQLVVCFREDKALGDYITCQLIGVQEQPVLYKVKTFKMWEHTPKYLYENKLFFLMPFTILNCENDKTVEKLQIYYDQISTYIDNLEDTTYMDPDSFPKLPYNIIKKLRSNLLHMINYVLENNKYIKREDFKYKEEDDMIIYDLLDAEKALKQLKEESKELENKNLEIVERLQAQERMIIDRDKALKIKDNQLQDKDNQLQDKDIQLQNKDIQLQNKDNQLQDKDNLLQIKDNQLQDLQNYIKHLEDKINAEKENRLHFGKDNN